MIVRAKATRVGQWWAVQVDVAGGLHTQARRLDQVRAMVADAVALVVDVQPGDVEVDLEVVLAESDADLVDRAHLSVSRASIATADAAAARVAAARALRDRGFTVRDTGELLGVSPQRVSQLLQL